MTNNPFEAERDAALGALLAETLTPAESASFTSRVLASLGARRSSWDVLASWARPGIAAGLLLASLLGYWLVASRIDDRAPSASELLASDQTTDAPVMDVVLGARR